MFWKITVWLWIRASAQRACSKMKMLIGLSRLVQRSSSGWASICGRAGGRPAAPPQPAGEACWRHAQPGPKFKEQHSGGTEHHQTGQPGNWMDTSCIAVVIILYTSILLCLQHLPVENIFQHVFSTASFIYPRSTEARIHSFSNLYMETHSKLIHHPSSRETDV